MNRVAIKNNAVIGFDKADFANRLGDIRQFGGTFAEKVEILGVSMGLSKPDAKQDIALKNEPVA